MVAPVNIESKLASNASANEAMVFPFLNSNLLAKMLFSRKLMIRSFSLIALKSPVPLYIINNALMNYLSLNVSF